MGTNRNDGGVDAGALVWGFIWGLAAGALVGLFGARRSGPETRRELSRSGQALVSRIEETVTPPDPVAESMAAGKAAARRRRADLGLAAKP